LKRREWLVLECAMAVERSKRPTDAAEFLKGFFGVTKLQKSLLAAVAVLVTLSGFLWYRNYAAEGPAVAFEQLPIATQTQFKSLMEGGNREWQFYEQDNNMMALWDAVDQYADAYRLHPRNRDAVSALERTADAFLKATAGNPAQQQALADALAAKSEHLAKYPPVIALKP
jgi:Ser/Thr protein kinase RdoA (MazF antagonist)